MSACQTVPDRSVIMAPSNPGSRLHHVTQRQSDRQQINDEVCEACAINQVHVFACIERPTSSAPVPNVL